MMMKKTLFRMKSTMAGNNIGDEGVKAICDAMKKNTTIREIYLGSWKCDL